MKPEKPLTLLEIRRAGLEALARELGPVGMIRFLQQYETGHGDYSVERHAWLDQVDLDTLVEKIRQQEEPIQD
jgi:hypothetical protein